MRPYSAGGTGKRRLRVQHVHRLRAQDGHGDKALRSRRDPALLAEGLHARVFSPAAERRYEIMSELGRGGMDLAYHHRHTPPPDPREHLAEMPEAMAELILELLSKDPGARPRRAADVALRLQAVYEAAR